VTAPRCVDGLPAPNRGNSPAMNTRSIAILALVIAAIVLLILLL